MLCPVSFIRLPVLSVVSIVNSLQPFSIISPLLPLPADVHHVIMINGCSFREVSCILGLKLNSDIKRLVMRYIGKDAGKKRSVPCNSPVSKLKDSPAIFYFYTTKN